MAGIINPDRVSIITTKNLHSGRFINIKNRTITILKSNWEERRSKMPFVYTFGMTSNDHVIYKWHEPRGLPVFSFSLLRVRVYRQDFHFHYEGLGFNSARSLKQSRAKRHDGSRRLETGEKKKN